MIHHFCLHNINLAFRIYAYTTSNTFWIVGITVRFKEPEYSVIERNEEVEVCLVKEGENSITIPVTIRPRESDPRDATGTFLCVCMFC